MERKPTKSKRRTIHCPCCGEALTDDFIEAVYMFRRRQAGGLKGGKSTDKFKLPEGWVSLHEASSRTGIEVATLRYKARSGNPAFQKFGRIWGASDELTR